MTGIMPQHGSVEMEFEIRNVGIDTGANVVLINGHDATAYGLAPGDRVEIYAKGSSRKSIAIVDVSNITGRNRMGLTSELSRELRLRNGAKVKLAKMEQPKSLAVIKERLRGRRLPYESLYSIVKDVVERRLSRDEITAFLVGLHAHSLTIEEAEYMSMAMVNTGEVLGLKKKKVFDKHSIGGTPGDKTTLLAVPIVAAAGLTIPKTSSRAITSAAGTADRAEAFMPVSLNVDEMRRIVNRINGCIVWGGAVHLAPADDIFIRAEYPLSIDPLLLPSIMSKKKAAGATDMVLDVPVGDKEKSPSDAELLIRDFMYLGRRMGINVHGAITRGDQPIGYAIGAGAEAREALSVIRNIKNVPDIIDKATGIAGMILELGGKRQGKKLAMSILRRGLAEKKMNEIISWQGGDPKIRPEEIPLGRRSATILSDRNGTVLSMNNIALASATRILGAPLDKRAAIILHRKLGENVKKGEAIFTLYSESSGAINDAEKHLRENSAMLIGSGNEMLIKRIVKVKVSHPHFALER